MSPVALAMSNQPVAFIISTASLKGNVMTDVPFLAGYYFHAA